MKSLVLDDLDYELPPELIAQEPTLERDGARLLVLPRSGASFMDCAIRDLPTLVPPALWIINDTRVIRARLRGQKPTGGRVEVLRLHRLAKDQASETWTVRAKASARLRVGAQICFGGSLQGTVLGHEEDGTLSINFTVRNQWAQPPVARERAASSLRSLSDVSQALNDVGEVPLPPYIRRKPQSFDGERYQTVYARYPGSVAAPTAGLHLSSTLMERLVQADHRFARVTLHVGPGTFEPLRTRELQNHRMHSEPYEIPEETAEAIAEARSAHRPVIAVGTTVVRTLESAVDAKGTVRPGPGSTSLFIYPPFSFRVVDMLLTNFHLPRSTLLALVMAFGGKDTIRRAYAHAIRARYRFFSYGDAMLISKRF